MRVLFVLHAFLPYPSGAGGFVMTWALMEHLRREGHHVGVVSYGGSGTDTFPWIAEARALLAERGVRVYEIPAFGAAGRLSRWARLKRAASATTSSFYPVRIDAQAFRDVWESERPDVLYLFTMKAVTALSGLEGLPPSVASVIDLDMDLLAARRRFIGLGTRLGWLYGALDRLAERALPGILTAHLSRTNAVIEHAAHHAVWLAEHGVASTYCPNPVHDPFGPERPFKARFPSQRKVFKVALIGAIRGVSTIAGLQYFAEELLPALESPTGRALEFHIIGKGNIPPPVRRLLDADERVQVRGFVPDIEAEFADADILLVPTPIKLGFRTRIAHGFSFGSVVVAHEANQAGMPELRDRVNCRLCSTPAEFSAAILNLAQSAEDWTSMARQARATFQSSYTSEVVCARMVEVMTRAAGASATEGASA